MAMTIQERRRRDRDKKRAQRASQRLSRTPPHHAVLKAIAEANSYAWAGVNIGAVRGEPVATTVDMSVVIRTASAILVDRGRFDAARSRDAIKRVLAPRPEHRWPGHVPTHARPSPEEPYA